MNTKLTSHKFHCTKCDFTCTTKPFLTSHFNKKHEPRLKDLKTVTPHPAKKRKSKNTSLKKVSFVEEEADAQELVDIIEDIDILVATDNGSEVNKVETKADDKSDVPAKDKKEKSVKKKTKEVSRPVKIYKE